MPTHDFANIGEVLDYELLKGTIISIDPSTDTCMVTVGGSGVNALLFYHCNPDSIIRDNGAIEGAAAGFDKGDSVIVMKKSDGSIIKVIGHTDGVRHCAPDVVFTISLMGFSKKVVVVWKSKEDTARIWKNGIVIEDSDIDFQDWYTKKNIDPATKDMFSLTGYYANRPPPPPPGWDPLTSDPYESYPSVWPIGSLIDTLQRETYDQYGGIICYDWNSMAFVNMLEHTLLGALYSVLLPESPTTSTQFRIHEVLIGDGNTNSRWDDTLYMPLGAETIPYPSDMKYSLNGVFNDRIIVDTCLLQSLSLYGYSPSSYVQAQILYVQEGTTGFDWVSKPRNTGLETQLINGINMVYQINNYSNFALWGLATCNIKIEIVKSKTQTIGQGDDE